MKRVDPTGILVISRFHAVVAARCLCWLSTAIFLSGCVKTPLIGNTKIVDKPINRSLIEVLEDYRRSIEKKDVPRILYHTHFSYRDEAGTTDPKDDIDYEGLKDILKSRIQHAEKIRYRIDYQRIHVDINVAYVDVWIDATFTYKEEQLPPRYQRYTDNHRFSLIFDHDRWQLSSGL